MTVQDVEDKIEERLALASIETSNITISSPDPACAVLADCFHTDVGYGREMTVTVSTQYRMGLVHVLMKWAGLPTTVTIGTDATMRHELVRVFHGTITTGGACSSWPESL